MTDMLDAPAGRSSPEACYACANAAKTRMIHGHLAPPEKLRNPAGIALMRGRKRALMCPLVNDCETMKEIES